MILVGSGALLWRAATHAVSAGAAVDIVIHPRHEVVPAHAAGIDHIGTDDVNDLADLIDEASTDGIVCSTGNPFIFRAPVLELGLTVVNVHGAPLPAYRGLPLVAAAFAILREEPQYGVTLHHVDAGIDTGVVMDRRTFAMPDDVTLEELSLAVTEECHALFVDNLDDLARSPLAADTSEAREVGEYFGRKRLDSIVQYWDHPRFAAATRLGVMEEYYPEYARAFGGVGSVR